MRTALKTLSLAAIAAGVAVTAIEALTDAPPAEGGTGSHSAQAAVPVRSTANQNTRLEIQVIERAELQNGLVREKLLLPGFDPDEPVPAIAIYPAKGGPFPVAFCLHGFRASKDKQEHWCRDLAAQGVFAIAPDAYLHGERSVAGLIGNERMDLLGDEYRIWVHQTSVDRTARDVSVILDALALRPDVEVSRVAVAGRSMGGSTAMVLGWGEPRVGVVASLIGAVDFWWDVTRIPPGPEQDARRATYGPRLQQLVTSLDPKPRADRLPPKALCFINGIRDQSIDVESVRRFVAALEPRYGEDRDRLLFAPFPEAAHNITPEMWRKDSEWIVRALAKAPASNPK